MMYNLLIVDDEWVIREGLTKTIPWEKWNIHVVGAASNGEKAYHMLQQHQVDILLTDIRMPGISGLNLVEKCRKFYPKMKIIFLTGHNEFNYAQTALKLGADDFLLKPTDVKELKKTMRKVINELNKEKNEETNILSILIRNAVKEGVNKNIADKIKSYHILRDNFGFLKIKQDAPLKWNIDDTNNLLIEKTKNEAFYLFFGIQDVTEWEEIITNAKRTFTDIKQSTEISVSQLTDDVLQLQNIYKQANVASDRSDNNGYVIVNRYLDTNYRLEMEKALLYIDQHFTESIDQTNIARKFHMSNGYFSKLFKQHTNMNFVEYLTKKRLEMAKKLLKNTNLKSYEIATEVGYNESRYFNQLFKKHVGCTPIEYRKKANNRIIRN